MENIKTDLLKEEWFKLESKLKTIDEIPRLYGAGNYYEGIDIDEDGITYRTSTSYSGCGSDYYSYSITWNEVNEPIDYFVQKFSKEIDDDKAKKLVKETADKKAKEERELAEFERLKLKYTFDV
jgi:hypothetical protein